MSARSCDNRMHNRRLRRAVALLIAGAFAVGAIELCYQMSKPAVLCEGVSVFADSQLYEPGADLDQLCEDKTAAYDVQTVPPGFEAEVIALGGYQEVRVDKTTHLVGFTSLLASDEVRLQIDEELKNNQWIKANTTEQPCDNYVKHEGVYRWLLIRFVQVGSCTSVVMQYQTTEMGGN